MKPTLIVRGAGGGVFEIDDPREGDTQRDEVLREQLDKGDLVIVEELPAADESDAEEPESDAEPESDEEPDGDAAAPAPTPRRPRKSEES